MPAARPSSPMARSNSRSPRVLDGKRKCTKCIAHSEPDSLWTIWLADRLQMAGSLVITKEAAAKSLGEGNPIHRRDVLSMDGDFTRGDVLHIYDETGNRAGPRPVGFHLGGDPGADRQPGNAGGPVARLPDPRRDHPSGEPCRAGRTTTCLGTRPTRSIPTERQGGFSGTASLPYRNHTLHGTRRQPRCDRYP